MGNRCVSLVSRWALTLPMGLMLFACGGGGDAGTSNVPTNVQSDIDAESTNRRPKISGSPAQIVTAGINYCFRPHASDQDGDTLVFRVANKPPWANFNKNSGVLEGKPRLADVGTYWNIRIKVADGKATTELASFTIKVLGSATSGFTLSWTPPNMKTDGSLLRDLAGYRIYLGRQAGKYSSVFEINNARRTAYVFEQLAPGTYYVAISAVDLNGNESRRSREVRATI